jgi:hypothetical protein
MIKALGCYFVIIAIQNILVIENPSCIIEEQNSRFCIEKWHNRPL